MLTGNNSTPLDKEYPVSGFNIQAVATESRVIVRLSLLKTADPIVGTPIVVRKISEPGFSETL